MADEIRSPKGCFKKGCLGCLGLLALAAVALLAILGLAALRGRDIPLLQSEALSQDLPPLLPAAAPPAEAPAGGGSPPAGVSREALAGRELPSPLGSPEPVRLALSLSKGEFSLEPGPPGQPIRVEAEFDHDHFELTQHYDAEERRYDVRFDARGGWLGMIGVREAKNRVRVIVPRDYPFLLDARISMGQSRLEAGGLWLTEARLRLGMGDHAIAFSSPLRQALDRLEIDGSMGQLTVDGVGNASPARARFGLSMGELRLDLAGRWLADATIDISCGMGQCDVRTPDDVALAIERASVAVGASSTRGALENRNPPPGAPKLTINATGGMGEVNIR